MKRSAAITALTIVLCSCSGEQEVAIKDNRCVDSTDVEMFDEKGRSYYVRLSCDSLNNLYKEMNEGEDRH